MCGWVCLLWIVQICERLRNDGIIQTQIFSFIFSSISILSFSLFFISSLTQKRLLRRKTVSLSHSPSSPLWRWRNTHRQTTHRLARSAKSTCVWVWVWVWVCVGVWVWVCKGLGLMFEWVCKSVCMRIAILNHLSQTHSLSPLSLRFFLGLSSHADLIRNVAFAGPLHHGKTTFMDMLVMNTHDKAVMEKKGARYTDTRKGICVCGWGSV